MMYKNVLNKLVFLGLISSSVVAACRPVEEAPAESLALALKGAIKMENRYSTLFAGYGRNSFQDTEADCRGEIVWSTELSGDAGQPNAMSLFGSRILLAGAEIFSLYSAEGEFLWSRNRKGGSPVSMTGTMIFFQDEHFRLSSVDVNGELKMENGYFPGPINFDYPIYLLWTGKKDHLSVIQFTGGAEELPKKVMVKRTVYGSRLAEWTYEVEGMQKLPPLYIIDKELVVIFADMIYFVSAEDGKEISRREYPLDNPLTASARPDGMVLLAGAEEGRAAVTAFSSEGDPEWKWIDEKGGLALSASQPPLTGHGGQVYLLAGRKVTAIEEGQTAWEVEIEEGPISFATLFKEGRLLAIAGEHLLGFDSDGNFAFDIEFDDSIIAPPVGAGDGSVYLLTEKELARVK